VVRFLARFVASALSLGCASSIAQVNDSQSSGTAVLAERIRKGDGVAVLEAGDSGNRSFVPQLLSLRQKPGKNVSFAQVQLALAKLGEDEELHEIRCEALFGSPSIQYYAVSDKLKYVGGWFSISTITAVLDNGDYRGGRDGAGLFAPPGWYALKTLPAIVPNAPEFSGNKVPFSEENRKLQRDWKEWIEAHKESLAGMKPTGAGLETSIQSCRKILKHDRTFDHKSIKYPCGDFAVVSKSK
jgi:hypothetical protein